jgi:CrcB protein
MLSSGGMLKYLLIFLGSGFGGVLRYGLGGLIQNAWGPTFPLGTMIVNITGCLGIGFCATAFSGALLVREEYRIAVLIGVLGGYTTFSSFGRETLALIHDGEWLRAGLYVLLTNAVGLAAVWLGSAAATKLYGPGAP